MNDMSLKAKIRNIAKEKKVSAQAVLQNYLMHRFLYRLSLTEYKEKFVIKGGMLIASLVGIEHRATMDLDTTLRNLPLAEESIKKAFETICSVPSDDGITYVYDSIAPIRDDDEYGGYRVSFFAVFGKINAPMSMDVSTGDVITPGAQKHEFCDLLEHDNVFELWSYPIETVLAEKVETILSRGVDNTRPRDFYDIYMLSGFDYDRDTFIDAFRATAEHRNSLEKITDVEGIIRTISESSEMNMRWKAYTRQMPYAEGIEFAETLSAVEEIMFFE
ncbi:MAG: nucleotidyl transferase AbiEii/AbiGii toxin family protein [Lachnospiraceae bacterium]|nr:nucleotidyl transferase AbiEii/AbiGii toxin family protein [Candidatus Equihabitans merdae]